MGASLMTLATSIVAVIRSQWKGFKKWQYPMNLPTAAFKNKLRIYATNFKSLFRDNDGSDRVSLSGLWQPIWDRYFAARIHIVRYRLKTRRLNSDVKR